MDVACSVQLSGLWESQAGLSQELQLKNMHTHKSASFILPRVRHEVLARTELQPMSPGPTKGTEHIPRAVISDCVWHSKRE